MEGVSNKMKKSEARVERSSRLEALSRPYEAELQAIQTSEHVDPFGKQMTEKLPTFARQTK